MTIKSRNRVSFIFFIASTVIFILYAIVTLYQLFTNNISLPNVNLKGVPTNFMQKYNPYCVFISLFIMLFYVSFTSFEVFRSFEKSQATDMLFFLLFLLACLCDTSRLLIPLLHLSNTSYSSLIIRVGNIVLLGRILAPLALFGTTVLSTEGFKQNTDNNCLIILIGAMFFAVIIPLNTGYIRPNYSISYGYLQLIRSLSVITCLVSIATLVITTIRNEYKPYMVIGFSLICMGYSIMFDSYCLLATITGPLILGFGTFIYLAEVHKHYLWID